MGYILNREAFRVVTRDERGRINYRKRYKRGDVVDVSKLNEFHLEGLVEIGALVPEDEYDGPEAESDTEDDSKGPEDPFEDSGEGDADDAGGDDAGGDADAEDLYANMDYASLQQEAKTRGLNGGGSAEDLRARLRDDDADNE